MAFASVETAAATAQLVNLTVGGCGARGVRIHGVCFCPIGYGSEDCSLVPPRASEANSEQFERSDAVRFAAWIRERQNPADCASAIGVQPSTTYFHKLGLGAQLVSLKFGLLQALLQGKVYHSPTSHYVNPVRCPSRSFDCYFEPPSACAVASHVNVTDDDHHWCADLPRRKLTQMAGLDAVHSSSWYHAQLAAYLYRPNQVGTAPFPLSPSPLPPSTHPVCLPASLARCDGLHHRLTSPPAPPRLQALREFRAEVVAHLASSAPSPTTASPSAAPLPTGSSYGGAHDGACVAMHVRRTDKHTEDKLKFHGRDFGDFARQLKSWEHWSYRHPAAPLHAFLGSEDNATFTTLPALLAPLEARWIPSSYFVMDAGSANAFKTIGQGNGRMTQIYREKEKLHRQALGRRNVRRQAIAREPSLHPGSSLSGQGSSLSGQGSSLSGQLAEELLARSSVAADEADAASSSAAAAARAAEARTDEAERRVLEHDEGMALIVQIELMSECEAFLGSYSSNIAVLVHDLMMARRLALGQPLHVIDVDGRVYCGCGASFCMELEESMTAQPSASVRGLINAGSFAHRAASVRVAPNPLAEAP